MLYIQQPSRIYLKIFDLLNAFRTRILLWFGLQSHNGKLPLKFIVKVIKINAEHYKQKVLATHLLPHADRLYPKKNWIFQQDSAPSHRSKTTQ